MRFVVDYSVYKCRKPETKNTLLCILFLGNGCSLYGYFEEDGWEYFRDYKNLNDK